MHRWPRLSAHHQRPYVDIGMGSAVLTGLLFPKSRVQQAARLLPTILCSRSRRNDPASLDSQDKANPLALVLAGFVRWHSRCLVYLWSFVLGYLRCMASGVALMSFNSPLADASCRTGWRGLEGAIPILSGLKYLTPKPFCRAKIIEY